MKKLSFALMLGFGLGFFGCSAATEGPGDEGDPQSVEQAASSTSCHYNCKKCPPNQVCALTCSAVGKCKSCQVLMLCVEGYVFDEATCRCVPEGSGPACGNGHCGAGKVCCNDSCGICTEPGGFCTMQACY